LLILGAAIAPLTVEAMHAMSGDQLHAYRIQQAASVKAPYIGLAIALAILAVIIGLFKLPVIESAEAHGHATGSVWQHPRLVLGAVAIFVYGGAEVSIGSLMTNYFNQKDIGNLSLQSAAGYLQYYWGGAMVGRFIGSALLQKTRTHKLLAFNAIMAAMLVAISMLTFGHTAMWSLILVGFFNSIMFPSIFALWPLKGLARSQAKAPACWWQPLSVVQLFQSCKAFWPTTSESTTLSSCPCCATDTSFFMPRVSRQKTQSSPSPFQILYRRISLQKNQRPPT
jgi:fucose permease